MLKYLSIPLALFLTACGQPVESDLSGNSSFVEAQPQGFMITEMQITSADADCQSHFGAYMHFKSQDGREVSHVECYNYKRTKAEPIEEKFFDSRFIPTAEVVERDFSISTLQKFCEKHTITDFGAMLFGDGNRNNLLNDSFEGYSCEVDAEKVTRAVIKAPEGPDGYFDLRTLKFFPNLRELTLETNTVYAPETFAAPKDLNLLVLKLVDGGDGQRNELFGKIAKNLPNIRFLEIYNYLKTTTPIKVDATFASYLMNLEVILSAADLSNISTLNGHENLKYIELPNSEDSLNLASLPNLVSIRYEADQGSNLNWNDRKFFSIFNQTFVR